MEETIGRNVHSSVLDLSLCVLRLPCILSDLKPYKYMLSSLEFLILFSRHIVELDRNFKSFDESFTISFIHIRNNKFYLLQRLHFPCTVLLLRH